MKTTFSDAVVKTPDAMGTHTGTRGGFPMDGTSKGAGLVNSPFTEGICPSVGPAETPSSELGTCPATTDVREGAGPGAVVGGIGLLESHQSDQTITR